jgi:rhodanese-related sulfurtransferase
MTVRELRLFLADLPDDMPVLVREAEGVCARDAAARLVEAGVEEVVLL